MGNDWWKEVLSFYIGLSHSPQEMEQWIRSKAEAASARSTNSLNDIPIRTDFLLHRVAEAFPGSQTRSPEGRERRWANVFGTLV